MIATEFELTRLSILHAVDSFNVKHELRSKRVKQFCQLFFPEETRVTLYKKHEGGTMYETNVPTAFCVLTKTDNHTKQ